MFENMEVFNGRTRAYSRETSDQQIILATPNTSLAVTGRPCAFLPNFGINEYQLTYGTLFQKREFHTFVHVTNSVRAKRISRNNFNRSIFSMLWNCETIDLSWREVFGKGDLNLVPGIF
jgi:hypothetical protein